MRIPTFSLFIALTHAFEKELEAGIMSHKTQMLFAATLSAEALENIIDTLEPIFVDYFNKSLQASNVLVERRIASLTNALRVPFKYDRNVLDRVNQYSVFKGYSSKRYTTQFTTKELRKLKNTILEGTYRGLGEDELGRLISQRVNMTERRARLLARGETQRLRESTSAIYASQPEVQEKYERVWITQGDGIVRPTHQEMNELVAGSDGYFYSPTYGKVSGPGSGPAEFAVNCRCRTGFKEK